MEIEIDNTAINNLKDNIKDLLEQKKKIDDQLANKKKELNSKLPNSFEIMMNAQ